MKIIHTSDWHLGKILHEHSLIEDQVYFLEKLIEFIKENPHDLMIIAGDIYDRSIPPKEAVTAFSNFICSLREITDMPVIITSGNHDSSQRISYLSEIIARSNIFIQVDPFKVDKPFKIGEADIYTVPYLDPYTFDIHGEDDEPRERTHENALMVAVSHIEKVMDSNRLNIFVGHLFTRGGSVTDSERKFIGASGEIDTGLLKNFDYSALGHLHRPQDVDERIRYSGSLLKYSFSEADDCKRLLSVDLGKNHCAARDIVLEPLRNLSRISGSMSDIMGDGKYDEYKDHYLEVELDDNTLVINPVRELSGKFNHILSIRRKDFNITATDAGIERREGMNISDDFQSFQQFLYSDNNKLFDKKVKMFNDYLNSNESEDV